MAEKFVTWQKLKKLKVPYDQWPEYAFKSFTKFSRANSGMGAGYSIKLRERIVNGTAASP